MLLHPNHATCRTWIDLGWFDALLSVGFRAVAVDARGFGGSDPANSARDVSGPTSTEDLKAVLQQLQLDTVHVCGFSLGAAAALRFALDAPERVKTVVLGGLGLGPLVQMGLYLGPSADPARCDALMQLERVLRSSEKEAGYFTLVREAIETLPLESVGPGRLRAPLLGVAGETDRHMPFVLYQQLRETGASLQTHSIVGAGHGTCFSDARFRQAAIDFVTGAGSRLASSRCVD